MTTQAAATTPDEQVVRRHTRHEAAHEAAHEAGHEAGHEHEREAVRLWLRLLSCTMRIENEISARLRSEFATTLPRFDLMAQLAHFPDGLTMGDLSQRLMVTGGNVTGVTDTLEREGFVERTTQPGDRRSRVVRLTPNGQAAFARMAAVHAGWVEELLGGLEEAERQQLYRLLGTLKAGLPGGQAGA